jgi:dTMP kinase
LQRGSWVVCDRFTDATYVYQGEGRNIPRAQIDVLAEWVQKEVSPDLTLVFDVPASIGLSRVSRRGEKDRFEREEQAFFERLRHAYLMLAAKYPTRCQVIDASAPLEVVRVRVRAILTRFLHDS